MAKRVQVILEDDLDGGEASETVGFVLDGVAYEIDLSETNAAQLRAALAVWVSHGRRTGGRKRSPGRSNTASSRSRAHQIREWAGQQGMEVSPRGRIPAAVQQAYDRAH